MTHKTSGIAEMEVTRCDMIYGGFQPVTNPLNLRSFHPLLDCFDRLESTLPEVHDLFSSTVSRVMAAARNFYLSANVLVYFLSASKI